MANERDPGSPPGQRRVGLSSLDIASVCAALGWKPSDASAAGLIAWITEVLNDLAGANGSQARQGLLAQLIAVTQATDSVLRAAAWPASMGRIRGRLLTSVALRLTAGMTQLEAERRDAQHARVGGRESSRRPMVTRASAPPQSIGPVAGRALALPSPACGLPSTPDSRGMSDEERFEMIVAKHARGDAATRPVAGDPPSSPAASLPATPADTGREAGGGATVGVGTKPAAPRSSDLTRGGLSRLAEAGLRALVDSNRSRLSELPTTDDVVTVIRESAESLLGTDGHGAASRLLARKIVRSWLAVLTDQFQLAHALKSSLAAGSGARVLAVDNELTSETRRLCAYVKTHRNGDRGPATTTSPQDEVAIEMPPDVITLAVAISISAPVAALTPPAGLDERPRDVDLPGEDPKSIPPGETRLEAAPPKALPPDAPVLKDEPPKSTLPDAPGREDEQPQPIPPGERWLEDEISRPPRSACQPEPGTDDPLRPPKLYRSMREDRTIARDTPEMDAYVERVTNALCGADSLHANLRLTAELVAEGMADRRVARALYDEEQKSAGGRCEVAAANEPLLKSVDQRAAKLLGLHRTARREVEQAAHRPSRRRPVTIQVQAAPAGAECQKPLPEAPAPKLLARPPSPTAAADSARATPDKPVGKHARRRSSALGRAARKWPRGKVTS